MMTTREEHKKRIALWVFGRLTETRMETLGDQKDFCKEVADMVMRLSDFFGETPLPSREGNAAQVALFTEYEQHLEAWENHILEEKYAYAYADWLQAEAMKLTWLAK